MFAIVGMVAAEGGGYQVMIQQVAAAVMFASLFEIIIGYTETHGTDKKTVQPHRYRTHNRHDWTVPFQRWRTMDGRKLDNITYYTCMYCSLFTGFQQKVKSLYALSDSSRHNYRLGMLHYRNRSRMDS